MDNIYERYRGLTDEETLNQVKQDYGEKAAKKLSDYGYLTLNEAMEYSREDFCEALGIPNNNYFYGRNGELLGFSISK